MDSNFPNAVSPAVWPEIPQNGNRQQFQQSWQTDAFHQPLWGREENNPNFMTPENSLLSYDSSANSGRLELIFYLSNLKLIERDCFIQKYKAINMSLK